MGFQEAAHLFAEARRECARSSDYATLDVEFRGLLTLADRHARRCADDPAARGGADLAERLGAAAASSAQEDARRGRGHEIPGLVGDLEPWLKSVLLFALPADYEQAGRAGHRFNLFEVILRLGLLSREQLELPLERYSTIADPVGRCVLIVKEGRNVEFHRPAELPWEVRSLFPTAQLVVILATLFRHRIALRRALSGLVPSPIVLRDPASLVVNAIRGERAQHLDVFAGRQTELAEILSCLDRSAPPWVVVTGTAGMGKSAVAAALTERLAHLAPACGAGLTETRAVAPWLPGSLLHLGKQCKLLPDVVNSLIAQANALLINPLPPFTADQTDLELPAEWELNVDLEVRDHHGFPAAESSLVREGDHSRSRIRSKLPASVAGTVAARRRASYLVDRCRTTLQRVLDCLVLERGEALLVVDALDEMASTAPSHDWLPPYLPPGARVILFSREDTSLARFLELRPDHRRVRLGSLRRDDIGEILGLHDAPSQSFVDKVHAQTDGWPIKVALVRQDLVRAQGDWRNIAIAGGDRYLGMLASAWQGNLARAILEAMGAFEPCAPLPIATIQGYLHHRALDLPLADLRHLLEAVADQLVGMATERVQLGLGPFADYLRRVHYSLRDWQRILLDVMRWLAVDDLVDADLASRFLSVWTRQKDRPIPELPDLRDPFLEMLTHGRGGRILWNARLAVDFEQVDHRKWLIEAAWKLGSDAAGVEIANARLNAGEWESGLSLLEQLVDRECPAAKAALARRLLDGDGVARNGRRGLRLLREAAIVEPDAKHELARRLLDGKGVRTNRTEGIRLLRESAEQSQSAKEDLANRLLDGKGVAQDLDEGLLLLREAARSSAEAKWNLGDRLLDGRNVPPNSAEGLRLVRESLAQLQVEARTSLHHDITLAQWQERLGERFLLGRGLPVDVSEARRLLYSAKARMFNLWGETPTSLSRRLLEGDEETPINVSEGLKTLREAADKDAEAAEDYGMRLLEGRGVPPDAAEGLLWLRRAADTRPSAAAELAERLLDGQGIPLNPGEGLRLLRQAASTEPKALLSLAERLLDGRGVPPNPDEGLELLRQAAKKDSSALTSLADRLIDGRGVRGNREEGLRLLRRGARKDDHVGYELAVRLSETGVSKDGEEAIRLLSSIAPSLDLYRSCLGCLLLVGVDGHPNPVAGLEHLRQGAATCSMGRLFLSTVLLDGRFGVGRDSDEGLALLRASPKEEIELRLELATRLLLGSGVPADEIEGRSVLEDVRRSLSSSHEALAPWALESAVARLLPRFPQEGLTIALAAFEATRDPSLGALAAHLMRRREAEPPPTAPSVEDLLSAGLAVMDTISVINHCLLIVANTEQGRSDRAWLEFNRSLRKVDGEAALKFWKPLAQRGDAEGELLVGLLSRLGIVPDPDGLSFVERLARARAGGWSVPSWMDEQTDPVEGSLSANLT